MADQRKVKRLMTERGNLITGLLSVLEKKVDEAQRDLLENTLTEFVDKLELTEGGRVRNTLYNKRLLASIDKVFKKFGKTMGVQLASTIAGGVQSVVAFGGQYYRMFSTRAELLKIKPQVQETVSSWLGVNAKGNVEPNGYLDTIIKDSTIKNQIKNFALRSVIGQQGWMETKAELRNTLVGGKDSTGKMQQYYRNFVYDLYSQVDRATTEVYAEKLGFEFYIYEGGVIKTTRPFCRKRNGKVFHRSEIQKFDPPTAKPPGYNPFTDLGGYSCRHHLNTIPNSLALILRPDAKKFIDPKTQ